MSDEPSALAQSHKLVQEQIRLLELAAATGDALRIQKESAILAAYSRREAGVFTLQQTDILGKYLDSLTRTSLQSTMAFGAHMERLSGEIRSFSDRADSATRYLAHWTAVLAAVTLLLALATGALVWVELKKGEAPPIVTTPPARSSSRSSHLITRSPLRSRQTSRPGFGVRAGAGRLSGA
jgi:hypothetical protein